MERIHLYTKEHLTYAKPSPSASLRCLLKVKEQRQIVLQFLSACRGCRCGTQQPPQRRCKTKTRANRPLCVHHPRSPPFTRWEDALSKSNDWRIFGSLIWSMVQDLWENCFFPPMVLNPKHKRTKSGVGSIEESKSTFSDNKERGRQAAGANTPAAPAARFWLQPRPRESRTT